MKQDQDAAGASARARPGDGRSLKDGEWAKILQRPCQREPDRQGLDGMEMPVGDADGLAELGQAGLVIVGDLVSLHVEKVVGVELQPNAVLEAVADPGID